MQPTGQMEWLIDAFSAEPKISFPKNAEKIKLSQLVSKLGFFYEKFRNVVDYHEEHLVRRNSLERLLKRQILLLQEKKAENISQTLIYEFIRAGYLPNDTLPETIINDIAIQLEKYLIFLDRIDKHKPPKKKKLTAWIISQAAAEINEALSPDEKENAMVNFMYSHLVEHLAFLNNRTEKKEKNLQIYVAILKTFAKADQTALRYALLKLYQPNWQKITQQESISFCPEITKLKNQIDAHLKHPLSFQLTRVIRPQAVFFLMLKKVMEKNPETLRETISNPAILEEKTTEVAKASYHNIHSKLIGTIFRVIIYIFLTKTILAFALELPYDYLILKQINWPILLINVVFHPILMFLVAMTIRVPGEKNTKIIVQEIKKIVYGQERKILFKPKRSMKRGSFTYLTFNFIYLIMFAISFGIVISALRFLHFNILSGILFVFFLTIVSFFGFRLRNLAKRFSVLPRKDNLTNFILDFISLPIIRVGRFLATNFAKINILLFILDFIIETPFKMLVEFFEKIVSFVREKREEISE